MSQRNQVDEYNKKAAPPITKDKISLLKSINDRATRLLKLISSENGKIKRN
jgi:flagellar motor switch protein FliM